jgi:hypothetical protein
VLKLREMLPEVPPLDMRALRLPAEIVEAVRGNSN